ncbi:MAG TPA: hypothetical protein VMM12_03550, partial [Longimicrobiales bacterium]|nr:hypothetical protein [Longimicrobiales bacterium]
MGTKVIAALLGLVLVAGDATAQEGQRRLGSVQEALSVSGRLSGAAGPGSVNWIEGGDRLSYTIRNAQTGVAEVRRYDPTNLSDQALFDPRVLTLPGTDEPLAYRSFEFGEDSRYLV